MTDRNDTAPGWVARIRAQDRRTIARSITAIENNDDGARSLVAALTGVVTQAQVLGVTGPPGAGKSTLVNAIAKELLKRGRSVAIVAVDPSSPITGGAVLGDRIRMGEVHHDERVFVRSLAARGHLGGLTRTTRDVVTVLAAAAFDRVIIETVGAGQSEVEIASVAATRVVVCPPGLGDDVQASKAGILEIADILVVNKGDLPGAERTERELRAMLALRGSGAFRPPVIRTVATTGEGVEALVDAIERHAMSTESVNRTMQALAPEAVAEGDIDPIDADPALRLERKLAARDAYMAHLGATLVAGGAGYAAVAMRVGHQHLNFLGGCHGGALFSLADMALGLACNSHGTVAALIDTHALFPVAVVEGDRLVANATEISRSRRLARYRIEVTRDDEMVASMAATVYLTGKAIEAPA